MLAYCDMNTEGKYDCTACEMRYRLELRNDPHFFFCFDPEMIPFFAPPLVSARPSSLSFPVAFTMAAAINVPLGRAFVKKKNK